MVVGFVASAVLKTHDSQATIFGPRCFSSSNHDMLYMYMYMIFRLVSDFRGGFGQFFYARSAFRSDW